MVRTFTSYPKTNRLILDAILLVKSRFLAGCILLLIGFVLILIILISCLLARKKPKSKGKDICVTRRILNGNFQQSTAPSIIVDSSEHESGSIQLQIYRTSTNKCSSSPPQKRLLSV